MKNKVEIQKEIDLLQEQMDGLKTRRDMLHSDRENILAGKKEKAQLISEALLDGRDASRESTSLEQDKAKLTALDNALGLAESRLSGFSQKRTDLQKALVHLEFDRLADETDRLLLACISKFQAAVDANQVLGEKVGELAQLAATGLDSTDELDRLNITRNLHQFFDKAGVDIVNRIKTMETSGSAQFLESRRKKTG